MSPRTANILFALIVLAFAFVHRHRMAEVSITWDEGGDLGIVECIQETRDPFACLSDISQTRLPFLIHSLAGPAWKKGHRSHYVISALFNLLTLIAIYAFARRVYGRGVATIAAALYATSIQLLASGRMLLSHSNIIGTFFCTAAFLTLLLFARDGKRRWLVLCAVAAGAAAASHPLSLFIGPALVAMYIAARRFAWRDLAFFPIAAATFFATSVIYIKPENFRALAIACTTPGTFPFWNYFDTGSPGAPWWFPLLTAIVKLGPWWILLAAFCAFRTRLDRVLFAFLIGFAVNLALKGAVFHYETPHHQVPWYPLLLVIAAILIARAWSRPVMIAFAVCLAMQLFDVVRFFPHYLFYGSQYGERFIGEFYGPAVMHAQGRMPVMLEIDRIPRLRSG
jgi:4-amino-4-deoxy-L-arabinose transferase-like glycosyltransferase